jgi:hypothetical protein
LVFILIVWRGGRIGGPSRGFLESEDLEVGGKVRDRITGRTEEKLIAMV